MGDYILISDKTSSLKEKTMDKNINSIDNYLNKLYNLAMRLDREIDAINARAAKQLKDNSLKAA